MTGRLQPLVSNQKIVNDDGTPTEYFIRWAQKRQLDIKGSLDDQSGQTLVDEWAAARKVLGGVGLSDGGPLSADVTLNLENTAVTPDTYGSATQVAGFTVDAQGRITSVTEYAIPVGIPDAPSDGVAYVRKNGAWVPAA